MSKRDEIAQLAVGAKTFIAENSKTAEKPGGSREVSRADYLKFMEAQGAPEQLLQKVSVATGALVAGAVAQTTDDLEKAVKDAMKAGDDPTSLEAKTVIRTIDGRVATRVLATRENRVPGTDNIVTKYGAVQVRAYISDGVSKAPAEEAAARIGALLSKGKK
jgi:hypothetical protein